MSGKLLPVLLLSLCLSAASVQGQGASQDAFIIQYMERRLVQLEVSASDILSLMLLLNLVSPALLYVSFITVRYKEFDQLCEDLVVPSGIERQITALPVSRY